MSSVVVPGVVLTAVLVGAGVAGWQVFVERDAGDPLAHERCVATAAKELDRLERVVDERFGSIPHTTDRYDGCDDTGRPSASLAVWVDDWTTRREGSEFLQHRPWRWDPGGSFATLEGALPLRANVLRSESNGVVRFAVVLSAES